MGERSTTWIPEPGTDVLLAWYEPLVRYAARARDRRIHWPILVEEFDVVRRTDRKGRKPVWTYRHRAAGGELHLDDEGQPFRFVPTPNGSAAGRFVSTDVRKAVFDTGVHLMEGTLWYEYPEDMARFMARWEAPGLPVEAACDGPPPEPLPLPEGWESPAAPARAAARGGADPTASHPSRGRRRGHLQLVVGGGG